MAITYISKLITNANLKMGGNIHHSLVSMPIAVITRQAMLLRQNVLIVEQRILPPHPSSSSSSSYGLTVKKYGIKDGVTTLDANVGTVKSVPTGIDCGIFLQYRQS